MHLLLLFSLVYLSKLWICIFVYSWFENSRLWHLCIVLCQYVTEEISAMRTLHSFRFDGKPVDRRATLTLRRPQWPTPQHVRDPTPGAVTTHRHATKCSFQIIILPPTFFFFTIFFFCFSYPFLAIQHKNIRTIVSNNTVYLIYITAKSLS